MKTKPTTPKPHNPELLKSADQLTDEIAHSTILVAEAGICLLNKERVGIALADKDDIAEISRVLSRCLSHPRVFAELKKLVRQQDALYLQGHAPHN